MKMKTDREYSVKKAIEKSSIDASKFLDQVPEADEDEFNMPTE